DQRLDQAEAAGGLLLRRLQRHVVGEEPARFAPTGLADERLHDPPSRMCSVVYRSTTPLAPRERAAAPLQLRELVLQLVGERGERLLPRGEQLELPLDEWDRDLDDLGPLLVGRALGPLAPQRGPCLLRLRQLHELLEREPEQVAQSDQLLEPDDVRLLVEPVGALGPLGLLAEQAALLVVTDRPGRHADALGDLADAQAPRVHAASSMVSGS